MLTQILRWLMQSEVWRFIGFGSAVVGLLCYALSSSFNHIFGQWTLLKIFLYNVFSFTLCLMILFAKTWQRSRSLRFKAHSALLVLTITSVYSFFSDKVMNGKPDAYSLISSGAFATMSLSLSRQTQCGFEADVLYFFLGCLIVQLMKIKLQLVIVGVGFSYSLIILRSSFSSTDAASQNEYVSLQDEHFVAIEVDSPQLPISTDIASMMQQLTTCLKALQQENSNLIDMLLERVKGRSQIVVTDHNFVIDALPSGKIDELHETVKLMLGAGFEKECFDAYSSLRREWLEECLIDKLLGLQEISIQNEKEQDRKAFVINISRKWIKALTVALRILFPNERRLCDRVFSGFSSASDCCFTELSQGVTLKLLNFADTVADESPSVWKFFNVLCMFKTLCGLIPEFQSMFPDSLVKEAIAVHNRLREASKELFMEFENLIFSIPEAKLVAPADGRYHPMLDEVVYYLISACRSQWILDQIADEAGTCSSFTAKMSRIIELLEKKLVAKSKNYKDPALRYIFMMNNRGRIEWMNQRWKWDTILGDDWFRENRAKGQQDLELYQRNSWNKVLNFLKLDINESREDKLSLFNLHFEEICRVQSTWSVLNEQVRNEIIKSLENKLLPAYGNFIGRLPDVLGKRAYEYIKYGMFDIQDRLNHLFLGSKMINQ
ncbi:Exocyst complex component Exo70 [Sesbania bispinosa]|nr:Exocyst complex component Exo70 [Sesbania bispinosa]